MTQPVIDALVESNLFWILLPSDLGGGGQGVSPFLEVVEELTRADASWGGLHGQRREHRSCGSILEPEATREMFGGPSKAITAGQLAEWGRGPRIEDGYRLAVTCPVRQRVSSRQLDRRRFSGRGSRPNQNRVRTARLTLELPSCPGTARPSSGTGM